MTNQTRQRRRRRNQTQQLMKLIGVLLAVLIAAVIIALCVNRQPADPGTVQTDPTAPKYTTLTVTSPAELTFVSTQQELVLQGTSDITQPVTVFPLM